MPVPAQKDPTSEPVNNEDHLIEPSHAHQHLGGRSARGGVAAFAAQASKLIVQLGSTAVLARFLTPDDFGLVAMVTALTGFLFFFSDLGLSVATIQRPRVTHDEASTVFWINVASGVGLAALTIAVSPLVAWFYSQPRLIGVMIPMSATFIFGGLTAQHNAILIRTLRFGAAAALQAGSYAVGASIGVLIAALHGGYWSLIASVICTSASACILGWYLSGWRPSRPRRIKHVKGMLRFGGALAGSYLLIYAIWNSDNVVVGRTNGPFALGLYSKAFGLAQLPVGPIGNSMNSVLMPVLSRLQGDPQRYRHYYLSALRYFSTASMSMLTFLYANAHQLVLLLLGQKWAASASILRILSIGAFAGIVPGTAEWILISSGRSDRLLKWHLFTAPIIILSYVAGAQWGALGVATAYSTVTCALAIPKMVWTLRDQEIKLSQVLLATLPAALVSILAGSISLYLSKTQLIGLGTLPYLTLTALTHVSLCVAGLATLPNGRQLFRNAADLIRRRRPRVPEQVEHPI